MSFWSDHPATYAGVSGSTLDTPPRRKTFTLRVVVDVESGVPAILGEYRGAGEDCVLYGHGLDVKAAPADCVLVCSIEVTL